MATHDVDETVLTLIGSGQADTRPAIVKQTGFAPSTVSAAVSRLVEAGVIAEAEHSVSTGGRRARRLVTSDGAGALALVELGAHHGLVALTDPTRGVGQASSLLIDIAEGPQVVLDAVMDEVSRQEEAAGVRVGGIALAVPGPVDAERSRVIRPARMPGWDGINVAEAIMSLAGTTNGHLATQGFKTLEKRTGVQLHDLAAEHEGKHIKFQDIVAQPQPVITSPEWSGSESGGRRYAPFTINVERMKPWHTLTGRMHFYLDHDWMIALGEQLPTYRGPLNMTQLFGEAPPGEVNELGVSVRYLTPHFKWAIHSQYQDNWFMQTLSRGGQQIWISPQDAAKVGIKDNDWVELVNRNGVVSCRAIVSHRMPEGTVYMYHAQDRLIEVPLTERDGRRGGIHNSMTRIMIKPTHIAGGYGQIAFAFNYYGPTGNNRDEVTMIRRRSQDVTYF